MKQATFTTMEQQLTVGYETDIPNEEHSFHIKIKDWRNRKEANFEINVSDFIGLLKEISFLREEKQCQNLQQK